MPATRSRSELGAVTLPSSIDQPRVGAVKRVRERMADNGCVPVSDHDRKVLWARAHNSCAICKRTLVADGTATDRESIVGDEAHIVARGTTGPRGGALADHLADAYDNLILLCKVDHKRIDDQPIEYTAERLHSLKAQHERWAADKFGSAQPQPIRVVDPAGDMPILLDHLVVGRQIWDVVAHSQSYRLATLEEGSEDEVNQADSFLDLARDSGEISDVLIEQGFAAVRQTERSLDEALTGLHALGLVVFGARRRLILRGGYSPPADWWEAALAVYRRADLEE
jgi:hypothetical protein